MSKKKNGLDPGAEYPDGWDQSRVIREKKRGTYKKGLAASLIGGSVGLTYLGLGVYGLIEGDPGPVDIGLEGAEMTLEPFSGEAWKNVLKILGGGSVATTSAIFGRKEYEVRKDYLEARKVYREKRR